MGIFPIIAVGRFSVDVLQPWALLGLLVLVPAVYLTWTTRSGAPRWREATSLALRCLAIIALVVALAGGRLARRSDQLCVIALVDQSKSIAPDERKRAMRQLADALALTGEKNSYAMIGFAGDSVLQALPGARGPTPTMQGEFSRDFTDIARALRLALSIAPQDAACRIVLVSDGNDTAGEASALSAAAAARQAGIPIDTYAIGSASGGEVLVERLLIDPRKSAGELFAIKAVIRSDIRQPASITLTRRGEWVNLSEDGYARTVMLEPGVNVIDVARQRLTDDGFYDYVVNVRPARGDGQPENNRAVGLVRVIGEPKVLIVDGSEGMRQGEHLRAALARGKINAALVPPGSFPFERLQFSYFHCLVLSDVPRELLSLEQMEMTRQWVENGGGLVWVGGVNSFAAGGYDNTPIEQASPVSCSVKREIDRASLALAIVIDKSGSMGAPARGGMKLDLANRGAVEAIRRLDHRDRAGVVYVDTAVKWIDNSDVLRPMDEGTKGRLSRLIKSERPGGGGIMSHMALTAALNALAKTKAMSKHVIFFGDTADCEQTGGCLQMAAKAHAAGMTISAIGLGTSGISEGFLRNLAAGGGGRVYFTDDAGKLPTIFVRDIMFISKAAFIEPEEGIAPTIMAFPRIDPILKGLPSVPKLSGQVATTLKGRAELLMHGPKPDDPLLAKWQYGLGRAVAWTSDARGHWAGQWVNWSGFSKFWIQNVRWAMQDTAGGNADVTAVAVIRGQQGKVIAEAADAQGKPRTDLRLRAAVESADSAGKPEIIELRQVSAGRYEGDFDARGVGAYVVRVIDENGASQDQTGAVMSYSPEFAQAEANRAMMDQVARASGGRVLAELANLFVRPEVEVFTYRAMFVPLLVLAMGLFFLDIVVRRFVLPERVLRWLTPARAHQRDQATLGRLQTARQALRDLADKRPLAVNTPPPPPPEARLYDDSPSASAGATTVRSGPAEREGPVATTEGSLTDRLRAAKRRAREEMDDIGRQK